jgi:hypothetical protein
VGLAGHTLREGLDRSDGRPFIEKGAEVKDSSVAGHEAVSTSASIGAHAHDWGREV